MPAAHLIRSRSLLLLAGLLVGPLSGADVLPAAQLNDPSDAGAAGMQQVDPAPAVERAVDLTVETGIHVVGGGFRGFGILARCDAAPAVRVVRSTRLGGSEPYRPATLVRVVGPDGHQTATADLTDQAVDRQAVAIPGGTGPAGIWRVSVQGGRQGDRVALTLPPAAVWGVRGESSLAVSEHVPAQAWLWLPPGTARIQIEQFGGQPGAITVADEHGAPLAATARRDGLGRRLVARIDRPAGRLLRLDLSRARGLALLVEGAPGLLCPTPEAALALRGGLVESGGRWCTSPLTARLHDWIRALRPEDIAAKPFALPATAPAGIDPEREVLLFGKYGQLSGLPVNLARGLDAPVPTGRPMTDDGYPFSSCGLAGVAAFASPLNPYAGDPVIVRRAALEAFRFALANLDGSDLLREGDLFDGTQVYPATHAFFAYPGLMAGPLPLILDRLDPATRALWLDLCLAVGDRQADFQGYESNQWLHNLHGHLAAYRASGERRFLGYFERAMRAFLAGAFGTDAKYGQHPAGYFLEEYGCDGNYDNMNLTALAAQWREYRHLPGADPALADAMLAACERNLGFKSLLWMTDRSGAEIGPTAHCSRRPDSTLIANNPAGDYLLRRASAVARARCEGLLSREAAFAASRTMPYRAVDADLARRRIAEDLASGALAAATAFTAGFQAHHFLEPDTGTAPAPAVLPVQGGDGTWQRPGIVAWKRGGLYGVVFHDVAGTREDRHLLAVMGGGPTALWSAGTGAALLSMAPPHTAHTRPDRTPDERRGMAAGPDQVLFSGVYATAADGRFVHSGKGRSTLRWIEPDRRFVIDERLPAGAGTITWDYRLEAGHIDLAVSAGGALRAPVLSLPLAAGDAGAGPALGPDGRLAWAAPAGRIEIAAEGTAPVLTPVLGAGVRCWRAPLPADGTPLRLSIRSVP